MLCKDGEKLKIMSESIENFHNIKSKSLWRHCRTVCKGGLTCHEPPKWSKTSKYDNIDDDHYHLLKDGEWPKLHLNTRAQ